MSERATQRLDAQRPELVVGVVGTGTMGRGIAQLAAQAGLTVRLLDARAGAAAEARAAVAATLQGLVGKGKLTAAAAEAAVARLVPVAGEAELAGCELVLEAVVEDLGVKRALLARLEEVVGPACVLATNTSSLSVTAIAAACREPGRVAGLHFFNPVPLMKVVEVVEAARTEAWVTDALVALVRRLGHRPVRAADTPGFVVNHAGRGYGTEALRILQEGVAGFADVDRVLVEAAGFRMGPFELFDLVGLDVSQPVMESVYAQFYGEPRFRPSPLLRQRVEAGLLGRKTGRGFYAYEGGKPVRLPEAALESGTVRPVWIAADELATAARLGALVRAAGWGLEDGERPSPQALCLVAPLGRDATTVAVEQGLPAAHTVAVDPLHELARRRTVMGTPVTRPEVLASAVSLLSGDGTPVTCIRDSPGFIAQRVLATVVNVACELVQQRIASPEDVDAAVTLGLGYPLGPLAWGDLLGPARVLRILTTMQAATGDMRYRPSLWLSRRARLGVSLLTVEG